jgi:hypothetical protein
MWLCNFRFAWLFKLVMLWFSLLYLSVVPLLALSFLGLKLALKKDYSPFYIETIYSSGKGLCSE